MHMHYVVSVSYSDNISTIHNSAKNSSCAGDASANVLYTVLIVITIN